MTTTELERTKALEKAASKGPWVVAGTDESGNAIVGGFCQTCAPPCYQIEDQVATAGAADAAFIADARSAVPALVTENETLQERLDAALGILCSYDISDDGDLAQCAPEDRWRLYRDLFALLKPETLEKT